MTSNRLAALLGVTFALAAFVQAIGFYILRFLLPLLIAIGVAILGLVAVAIGAFACVKRRDLGSALVLLGVAATWAIWVFAPTRELAVQARYGLYSASYRAAVVDIERGIKPKCLVSGECLADPRAPGYVVFPYPGFLNNWLGVVYAPTGQIDPKFSEWQAFASLAACDTTPISGKFYICNFY